jgi:hypothetical protein
MFELAASACGEMHRAKSVCGIFEEQMPSAFQ